MTPDDPPRTCVLCDGQPNPTPAPGVQPCPACAASILVAEIHLTTSTPPTTRQETP